MLQEIPELVLGEHLALRVAVFLPNLLNYSLGSAKYVLIVLQFGYLSLLTRAEFVQRHISTTLHGCFWYRRSTQLVSLG